MFRTVMIQSIKQWREDERPREKMFSKGCESLTAAELIAILIRSGSRSDNAVSLAGKILEEAGGSLTALSRMSSARLCRIPGVGRVKALSILAAAELGRRTALEEKPEGASIDNPADIACIMRPILKGLQHEELWVLYLDRAGRLIGKDKLSSGGTGATVVDVKMVARSALERLASGVVLVHNHPSGIPNPGKEDIRQTALVKEALSCLDISLVDHVIIAGNRYFSFSDENR